MKRSGVSIDGGEGSFDGSRNIGEGKNREIDDDSRRKTRMERMREEERERDREGCWQDCSRRSG